MNKTQGWTMHPLSSRAVHSQKFAFNSIFYELEVVEHLPIKTILNVNVL